MHTIIRDRETTVDDFVFYTDRLLRLVTTLIQRTINCKHAPAMIDVAFQVSGCKIPPLLQDIVKI